MSIALIILGTVALADRSLPALRASLLARVYRVTAKSGGNLSIGQQLAITGVYDLLRCGLEAPQIEDLNQLSL